MAQGQTQTQWHRLLGKLLEEALTPVGIQVYTEFPLLSAPPAADILLLRRTDKVWTPEQRARLPDGVRESAASHILLEFKYTESVNEWALRQALAYDTLYKRTQRLDDHAVQSFVLSSKKPNAEFLAAFGYEPSSQPGVYYSRYRLVQLVPILSLNELPNATHNLFVRLFASRRQEKRIAFEAAQQATPSLVDDDLQDFVAGLRYYWFTQPEVDMASRAPSVEEIQQLGQKFRQYLASLPPEERMLGLSMAERLAGISPEQRLAGLAPEQRLAGLAPEQRLAGISPEQRLAGLAPEDILSHLPVEQIEAYLAKVKRPRKSTGRRKRSAGSPPEQKLS